MGKNTKLSQGPKQAGGRPPRRSKRSDHEFRSKCSISRALDIVGDKWTLLIVRDLLWHGKHTFAALQGSAENIPTNILADRLQRLVDWGLVRREPYQERPPRFAYHLTETGQGLEPALVEVLRWGHRVLDGGMPDRLRE
jgi:DNA-binding HxlR family transcriptional regulator